MRTRKSKTRLKGDRIIPDLTESLRRKFFLLSPDTHEKSETCLVHTFRDSNGNSYKVREVVLTGHFSQFGERSVADETLMEYIETATDKELAQGFLEEYKNS